MKLNPLYVSIADAANWVVSEEGFVSKKIIGKSETEPVLVKGQRLALPYDKIMGSTAKDIMIFHPLREDVLNPDTDVLDVLRKSLNTRLNITTCWLITHLLALAKSPDDQARMNPDQSFFLSQVKKVDDSTFDDMKKIMAAMKVDAKTKTTVSIFTKKGGIYEGKKHNCVGVVKFAMYDELKETLTKDGKPEVFGVKLSSKKNRDAILAVMEYIYPQISTPEYYNYGSSSQVAAFMDALMQSFGRLASDLNVVVDLFSEPDLLDGQAKEMRINGEWMATFQDLGAIRNEVRMVPHQKGNVEELVPAMKAASAVQAAVTGQPAAYVGVAAAEPVKLHTDKGLDFAALMADNQAKARQAQTFGFTNNGGFANPRQQQPNNPILNALAPAASGGFGFNQQPQRQAHPFAEFQTGQRSGQGGSGFGNAGGNGGFGFGRSNGGGRGF